MYKSAGKKLNIKIYFHCRSVEFESRSQAVAESILSRKESGGGGAVIFFLSFSTAVKQALKGRSWFSVFVVACGAVNLES